MHSRRDLSHASASPSLVGFSFFLLLLFLLREHDGGGPGDYGETQMPRGSFAHHRRGMSASAV